ncbi:MAG: hypothetical protein ACXVXO_01030 [Mycobacteriaceae bacterium]
MSADDLTRDEIHDRVSWLKSIAAENVKKVHAKAAFHKPVVLTDAESAAIARKKLESQS